MIYELAGLGIAIQDVNNGYLVRRMKDYISSFGAIRIRVTLSRNNHIQLPKGESIFWSDYLRWLVMSDGTICAYRRADDIGFNAFLARFSPSFDEIELEVADIAQFGGFPIEQFEFYLLGEMLQMMLPMADRLVLHSSAIAYEGNGIAFTAPSGTGKSTHAALWLKNFPNCTILNDDTPIVWQKDGELCISGSPWSGKTEQNQNITVPLKAVVCLERGMSDAIRPITPRESMPFLLHECKSTPFTEREEKRIALLEKILNATKVYKLSCTPLDAAAILCKNQIWQEMC